MIQKEQSKNSRKLLQLMKPYLILIKDKFMMFMGKRVYRNLKEVEDQVDLIWMICLMTSLQAVVVVEEEATSRMKTEGGMKIFLQTQMLRN